jgi:Arc/MetJ-type ribon-helix-helix transcriptional regulator
MKSITVRLPDAIVAEIRAESRERNVAISDVIRDRLQVSEQRRRRRSALGKIADLIGSVKGLPADLSGNKKAYLGSIGYGRKRSR